MRAAAAIGIVCGVLVGCSMERQPEQAAVRTPDSLMANATRNDRLARPVTSLVAALPDRGSLVAYPAQQAVRKGSRTWHPVQLSEEHALGAITSGQMVVDAPGGRPIALKYERHVEHADGNWTWIGRTADGQDAIVTFGEKAVFGSIPNGEQPLELTMASGRAWMVETDAAAVLREPGSPATPDFIPAPGNTNTSSLSPPRLAGQRFVVAGATMEAITAATTVDLALGYTSGFATRLGGQSQALTRLNFIVDTANAAFANSQVDGRFRLVQAIQVNYPDATSNRTALFELTGVSCVPASGGQLPDGGVSCTQVGQPAALQPLIAARERYGADLVALVRNLEFPENQSCGVAWLVGGGQQPIDAGSAAFGMSVISDSSGATFPDDGNTCRHETLAHELGHNFGLQHDAVIAQGTDDTDSDGTLLDPEEYGRFPYSFGYSAGAGAGNFYTIMAIRRAGQVGYRVFSNPRITTCGGFPCGVANQADNARALAQTIPVIAGFRTARIPLAGVWHRGDFNADGRSDLLWRNQSNGSNVIWWSGASPGQRTLTPVPVAWHIVGVGDFNADGASDLLWRNLTTGANVIWRSANPRAQLALTTVRDMAWSVAGIGDFNADGRADILWRNGSTGANTIWRSGNSLLQQRLTPLSDQSWNVVGIGDFDGDNRADILWRNLTTGGNVIWRAANSAAQQTLTPVSDLNWVVAGVADFNDDGRSDVLWRNLASGGNALWRSAASSQQQQLTPVANQAWVVAAVGDFNGDGRADIFWRNLGTGANDIWRSGTSTLRQPVSPVTDFSWFIAG